MRIESFSRTTLSFLNKCVALNNHHGLIKGETSHSAQWVSNLKTHRLHPNAIKRPSRGILTPSGKKFGAYQSEYLSLAVGVGINIEQILINQHRITHHPNPL